MVPSGMGGIQVVLVIVLVVLDILVIKYMKTQKKKEQANPGLVPLPWQKNLPQIISGILLFIVLLVWIFGSSGGSSRSSGVSGKPWKELGVSEREYMQVYNKYKYGE